MKRIKLAFLFIVVFPVIGYCDQETLILSASPNNLFAIHDYRRTPEFSRKSGSSSMFLVEQSSGTRLINLPETKYGNPHVAWTSDSKYLAVVESTRSSYLNCYHQNEDKNWIECKIEDANLAPLLNIYVDLNSLAFNRSGELCLLFWKPEILENPDDKLPDFVEIKINRYAVAKDKLTLLDSKLLSGHLAIGEVPRKIKEIKKTYEGGLFPLELTELGFQFKLFRKMDSKFHLGYYVSDKIGNRNILKVADAVPGAGAHLVKSYESKLGERHWALLAPVGKDAKPKLYLLKEAAEKIQVVNLDEAQILSYVETTKSMGFDHYNRLYLFCEKREVGDDVGLSVVRISTDQGVRLEEISHKVVASKNKEESAKQMKSVIQSGNDPLNIDFEELEKCQID